MPRKRPSSKKSSPQDNSELASQSGIDASKAPFPVVGIGASAGGLEAFTQLLSHLSANTGMAFVLVQHLDPKQKSLLSEILARTTAMPVQEAQEGMAIAPNQVYVIPPNTLMTLRQGCLHLSPRSPGSRVSRAVDMLFNSLAEDRGNRAIAVILSGGDRDGSQGLEAIKAAGGITFAQTADSAQVSSMPSTAIATGQVDFILSPEAIADELTRISHHPYIAAPTDQPDLPALPATHEDDFVAILQQLQTAFGVDFRAYKRTTLQRRIQRRMALHHLETLADYRRYLESQTTEIQALYEEILIHVTGFFRDPEVFKVLKRDIFPTLLRDRPPEVPLRIWVAGCSTGEEAYSIAIVLLEFLAHQPRQPQIQIFATDVSERVIEKARSGVYLASQVADVSAERLQRFFVPMEGGYQINKTVRELCIFARQNLASDPPFSRLDLISCRNVLIYFGAALQHKILPMFHYGLRPSGFLLLGSAETVGDFSSLFHLVSRTHKIYTKQPSPLLMPMELSSPVYAAEPSPAPAVPALPAEASLLELVDQVVLSRYAPVGVVVNSNLDIVQFRGQTGAYLAPSPGQASLNVLSMVREELRLELRTLLHQVRQTGQAATKTTIAPIAGSPRSVQIDVDLVSRETANETYILILFTEVNTPSSAPETTTLGDADSPSQASTDFQRLEQDLKTTKAYLQSIIEEQEATNQDLRAANEEILSSNEELQSTNEELQTAKEEIQATNEELSTINDELYRRNAETMQVSNDFQNLLSSINIPILMLEADLRIRRFTPTAAALFNLIPSDIGRPLSDIKHNLNLDDLEAQILEVISTLVMRNQEVQDHAGHWYDLRIRPYRTLDDRIDGAVVVLVEIDALKRSTEQLREARDYADSIVQTVREGLVVLDSHLTVVTANQRFYRMFQVNPAETEHVSIFELGNGQWNIPQLRSLLEDILPENSQVEDFVIDHVFESIGAKKMSLNACKMLLFEGGERILLSIEEVVDS
ncbi:MAG: chemotaxis protein CheB [Spirulina sp.]